LSSYYRRRRFAAFFRFLGAALRFATFFRFLGAALRFAALRARFFAGIFICDER